MNFFITGSNGFVGYSIARRLSSEGHSIRCLVRSPERFEFLALLPGTIPVIGDIFAQRSVIEGMEGVDVVFHLAAFTKPWSKDKSMPYRINVEGTRMLLDAAFKAGVKRFVFTSSAGVIGPSINGHPADEKTIREVPFFNDYEQTKAEAEKIVLSYKDKAMDVVIVNPSRIYGPGPDKESNSILRIIRLYEKGLWRILPGNGNCTGNYVYIDDVVNGHLLAALKGKTGERYILGGENLTFNELFGKISEAAGKRRRMVKMPGAIMSFISETMEWQAKVTGLPPVITSSWVKKYLSNSSLSSKHAIDDLGYAITPFSSGVAQTIKWMHQNDKRE